MTATGPGGEAAAAHAAPRPQVGGAQCVFQNVESALGTALMGAILMAGQTSGFQTRVLEHPEIPADVAQYIVECTKAGVAVVSEPQVVAYAEEADLPPGPQGPLALDATAT